ncbi:colanic acid biosynthesis glycosyltransferase WcaL [Sphingomonas sp. MA1305]|uniref:glycosyltransferase family 4 protein n=1 Tax=Sphingomonas sp. MA1305 TaxID=2479204 RepID=UPI0018DF838A|nr:glycosyltransferase family 4 protein [Sphingomonas sp. MA1305]MBI0477227.1 colanic acid biosynthesis glycosyltransferase WcaL [Sphingomonas sp. MA1305]
MTQRIGYLTSQYPAPSHTFIRREIAAVRALGLDIVTYSIQRPPAGLEAPLDRAAAADTFTVLAQPKPAYAKAHLSALVSRPGRYLTTLALAWRHRVPGARSALWALFHFAEAILLARRLEADGVRHLHNHFANSAATVGLLASRFAGIDWSLTLHGISEFDYPAGLLLADKIAAADFVACVSRFGMAQTMRTIPTNQWHKLSLVRCGVDLADLPPTADRPSADTANTAPQPLQLIAVGRLSPEKGQAGLLEAVALLRDRGVAIALTLVGDGPESASLRALATQLGVKALVRFVGRQDERTALASIAAADVLVLPSFMEGLPVVLMEAMALGVPVIATRVAGIPELVRDEVSGLLFDPADWHGLADTIARLAADPALRARLAAAARQRVEAEFAIDRAVAPLPALFASPSQGPAPL